MRLSGDTWDGVIIENAYNNKGYEELKRYFLESTWYFQYYFLRVVFVAAEILDVSYKNINAIFVLMAMVLLLRETRSLSESIFGLRRESCTKVLTLVAVFPAWNALQSSTLTYHLFSVFLGLLAIRILHQTGVLRLLTGLVCLTLAFGLQSQLAFLPALSYVYDLLKRRDLTSPWIFPSITTLIVLSAALSWYIMGRILFPPSGIFENYQHLIIVGLDGLLPATLRIITFGSYLIPIAFSTFFLVLTQILHFKGVGQERGLETHGPTGINTRLVSLIILIIFALLPYAAVGRQSLWWDFDYSSRQAFLLAVPISLLSAFLFETLSQTVGQGSAKSPKRVYVALVLTCLIIQTYGTLANHNRQIFLDDLEQSLRIENIEWGPSLVQLVGSGLPGYIFEFYEPNYVISKVTDTQAYTRVGQFYDEDFSIPCNLRNRPLYEKLFMYKSNETSKTVIVDISAFGYSGLRNMVSNSAGISKTSHVRVEDVRFVQSKDPLCVDR